MAHVDMQVDAQLTARAIALNDRFVRWAYAISMAQGIASLAFIGLLCFHLGATVAFGCNWKPKTEREAWIDVWTAIGLVVYTSIMLAAKIAKRVLLERYLAQYDAGGMVEFTVHRETGEPIVHGPRERLT